MGRMATGALAVALILGSSCGRQVSYRPIATVTEGGTSVTLATPTGAIGPGRNRLQVSFTGVGETPVDVTRATVVVRLGPLPADGVNRSATIQQSPPLSRVSRGVYRTRYDLNKPGSYQVLVTWAAGGQSHRTTFVARIPLTQPAPHPVDQVGGPPGAQPAPKPISPPP